VRWEFSVELKPNRVSVDYGVLRVRSPELVTIVRDHAQNPSFALDVTIENWDMAPPTARFRINDLAKSAKVVSQDEIQIAVPEVARVVQAHHAKRSFVLHVHLSDDVWQDPPVSLAP
jgi:hypothetical protein